MVRRDQEPLTIDEHRSAVAPEAGHRLAPDHVAGGIAKAQLVAITVDGEDADQRSVQPLDEGITTSFDAEYDLAGEEIDDGGVRRWQIV